MAHCLIQFNLYKHKTFLHWIYVGYLSAACDVSEEVLIQGKLAFNVIIDTKGRKTSTSVVTFQIVDRHQSQPWGRVCSYEV